MRFEIRPASLLGEWPEVYRAYVSGADGRVFPTRIEISTTDAEADAMADTDPDSAVFDPDRRSREESSDSALIPPPKVDFDDEIPVMAVRRQVSDSGFLHVAFPVEGFGRPVIRTGSLCEREEPYLLAVELARGQLSQLRDQMAAWEGVSDSFPPEVRESIAKAHQQFGRAATMQHTDADQATDFACECLSLTLQASELATQAFTSWNLTRLRQHRAAPPAALGAFLGFAAPSEELKEHAKATCSAIGIPVRWRDIEPEEGKYRWQFNDEQVAFGAENHLLMVGGPLLDFSRDGLPKWLANWCGDFFNLQSFVSDFVETAVSRYVGAIRHWEVAARANTGGAFGGDNVLDEETRLALAARSLDVARQVDEEIQLLIRIDEPWSAYQSRGRHQLSAMQFADALQRMGTGVAGINLEVAIGYRPRGSYSRGLLEFAQMLNHWGMLGLPLYVTLAVPSCIEADKNATPTTTPTHVESGVWKHPWNPTSQGAWIDAYLPLIIANPQVVAVFWSHFSDAEPHEFPHTGLLDGEGKPKESCDRFQHHRAGVWLGDTAYMRDDA